MDLTDTFQLEQKSEQLKLVQDALDEKRAELLHSDTQLRTIEERYYGSTGAVHEQVVNELRVSCSYVVID